MKAQQQHISTRYTLIPITDPAHQAKLQTYMSQPQQPKTSFCRFYLRGLCIMKPHLCKFAHKFEDLILQEDDEELIRNCSFNEKERKKLYFQSKQDFQQKALFILKNIDYLVLHSYQFEERWKHSHNNKKVYTVEEIKSERSVRIKLREVMHRENMSKLIDYLVAKHPGVDFSISYLSKWFSKAGFQKPQTRCKFGDFMRYMIFVKQFKQVNILMPPRLQKTVFFINCSGNSPKTYIHSNIVQIEQLHLKAKQEYKKEMQIKLQPLPEQMWKRFICRYYMAGNCEYTEEECRYAHSVGALRYQLGQSFQIAHKQVVKGRQERLNYISLHRYSSQSINPDITLQQLNDKFNLRSAYRKKMHLLLYGQFMQLLQTLTGDSRFKLGFIEREYNGAGFNHSQENKFWQFESSLWDIGYIVEEVKLQNSEGKSTYVYKIPPIEQLDQYYRKQVNLILREEVKAIQENEQKEKNCLLQNQKNKKKQSCETEGQTLTLEQLQRQQTSIQPPKQVILQSSFRKKLYRNQQPFIVQLHVYLRLKSKTLQQIIKQLTLDKDLLQHIFFQTNEQNYKKLVELCKGYFRGKKEYIHRVQHIEAQIKKQHKDQINLNHYVNLRNFLHSALIDAGKRVYFLAFGNNCFCVDKGNMPGHEKVVCKGQYQLKDYTVKSQQVIDSLNNNSFSNDRIVIVDNQQAEQYAELFLSQCNKLGVDLEGRLKKQGYIDLIQISSILNGKKQIFVFDIFYVQKLQNNQLHTRIVSFLKLLFEDPYRVKILHDCKQDSTALRHLMGIKLKNVFDTSGMSIVLEQKQVYEQWNKKDETNHHILKRVFEVKTPGLNSVLDKWGAPNGVNIFKESMKKRFHEDGPRTYFEQRPIDPQFLEYSAQDVEDLVDVYEAMKKQDTDRISEVIGEIFSTFNLNEQVY